MPVTVELYAFGLVIPGVLGPLIMVQVPVPTPGLLPTSVVLVTLQRFCAVPAFAMVGGTELIIVTVLIEAVHVPFEMLHWKT